MAMFAFTKTLSIFLNTFKKSKYIVATMEGPVFRGFFIFNN